MPRSVLITTSTLVILAALAGYRLGQRQLTVDASGIIDAVAARHVAEHGGDISACQGWEGDGVVVFEIRCGDILYHVDRLGRVTVVVDDSI